MKVSPLCSISKFQEKASSLSRKYGLSSGRKDALSFQKEARLYFDRVERTVEVQRIIESFSSTLTISSTTRGVTIISCYVHEPAVIQTISSFAKQLTSDHKVVLFINGSSSDTSFQSRANEHQRISRNSMINSPTARWMYSYINFKKKFLWDKSEDSSLMLLFINHFRWVFPIQS